METWDAIRARRDVRSFAERSIDDQELARELLRFPVNRVCAHLIPLGCPADRPLVPLRHPDRRALERSYIGASGKSRVAPEQLGFSHGRADPSDRWAGNAAENALSVLAGGRPRNRIIT